MSQKEGWTKIAYCWLVHVTTLSLDTEYKLLLLDCKVLAEPLWRRHTRFGDSKMDIKISEIVVVTILCLAGRVPIQDCSSLGFCQRKTKFRKSNLWEDPWILQSQLNSRPQVLLWCNFYRCRCKLSLKHKPLFILSTIMTRLLCAMRWG